MYHGHISALSTSIAISALKQFIIYIWHLEEINKLEVARVYMIASNGWYTHCCRSEGRGERIFTAGKAQEINKQDFK